MSVECLRLVMSGFDLIDAVTSTGASRIDPYIRVMEPGQ